MEDTQPTLANWRLPPFNREAFSRVREIIPTASINRIKGIAIENNEPVNIKLTVKIRENEETVGKGLILSRLCQESRLAGPSGCPIRSISTIGRPS